MHAQRSLTHPLLMLAAVLWSSQLFGAEKARTSPELVSDDFGFSSSAAAAALDADAADDPEAGAPGKEGGHPAVSKGKKERPPGRDPVALAFALPRGVVLNAKQQEAFGMLKDEYEQPLRDALDRREQASQPNDKLKAAREVTQVRAKITAGIQQILDAPRVEASFSRRPVGVRPVMPPRKFGPGRR